MLIETILLAIVTQPNEPAPSIKQHVKTQTISQWNKQQWQCLDQLIQRESNWNPKAKNPTSTAYGLFQQLRLKQTTKPDRQTTLGLKYIKHRYGSPCKALKHHNNRGWY